MVADGWEGWGELTSTGMSALGKHGIEGKCGSFLGAVPPCQPQGLFCLYQNWADRTSLAWSLALQPVSPPGTASSDGCWTASSREPHRQARCCGVTEERVGGKKGWGRWIFSALMKNCDWFCRLRRGCSRPASQLLISFQAWRGKSSNACPVSTLSSKAQPFWL